MDSEIELPYLKNNNFQNELTSLLDEFEVLLTNFKNFKSNEVRESVFEKIEEVFDLLQKCYENKDGKIFLNELRDYSKKILKNDLDYFYRLNTNSQKPINQFFECKISTFSLFLLKGILLRNKSKIAKNLQNGSFKREELTTDSGIAINLATILLNIDFKVSGIFSSLKKMTGENLSVVGCALELSTHKSKWWLLSDKKNTPKTTYLHLDEGIGNPKAITYLSSVNLKNGPFSVIKNQDDIFKINYFQSLIGRAIGKVGKENSKIKDLFNHKYHQTFGCKNFKELFELLPSMVKFNSHFGFDVIPNSLLEEKLIQNEIVFTGKPGKTIVFDGSSVLHRGGLMIDGERLALQIVLGKKEQFYYLNKILRYVKS
jgi:hypothetical protein